MSGFGRIFDRFAIGLSSLCLVHCLATPLLLILLPAASLSFAFPDSFHLWMVLAAIPVSILALRSGHKYHGHMLPTLFASAGLCFLSYGAILATTARLELVLTVFGALLLAGAHLWNGRLAASESSR